MQDTCRIHRNTSGYVSDRKPPPKRIGNPTSPPHTRHGASSPARQLAALRMVFWRQCVCECVVMFSPRLTDQYSGGAGGRRRFRRHSLTHSPLLVTSHKLGTPLPPVGRASMPSKCRARATPRAKHTSTARLPTRPAFRG